MIDYITLTGGVVADPELRFTPSGAAVANFRIAQSDSKKNDAGEWEKVQSLYLSVNIWNDNPQYKKNPIPWAEMSTSIRQGDRVAVHGKLVTRSWEAKDGSKRSQIEFNADSFFVIPEAPQQPAGNGFGEQPQHQGGFSGQQAPAPQQGVWGKPAPVGQQSKATDEEPPF